MGATITGWRSLRLRKRVLSSLSGSIIAGILLFAGCSTIPDRDTVSPVGFTSLQQPGPRATMESINMVRLRMDKPAVERLGPGDVLGIYIANVTGKEDADIPIHNIEVNAKEAPASGYPFPVRSDGTISLPLLKEPIYVEGMSIIEAEDAIRAAYTVNSHYLAQGANISVTMIKRRTYHVSVIREDVSVSGGAGGINTNSSSNNGSMESYFGSISRGSAVSLELPAYRNDILEALSQSGGMPGLNAKNELIILRKGGSQTFGFDGDYLPSDPAAFAQSVTDHYNQTGLIDGLSPDMGIIRIPLRVSPDAIPPKLTSEDVTLLDGDVIYIQSRDAEVYYTGGLVKGGAFPIPRDYDLDVLGAIATAGGGLTTSFASTNSSTGSRTTFMLPPSKILVLRNVNGRQTAIKIRKKDAMRNPSHRILVEPNDVILLEYTNWEIFFNLVYSCIDFRINPKDFWDK